MPLGTATVRLTEAAERAKEKSEPILGSDKVRGRWVPDGKAYDREDYDSSLIGEDLQRDYNPDPNGGDGSSAGEQAIPDGDPLAALTLREQLHIFLSQGQIFQSCPGSRRSCEMQRWRSFS